MKDQKKILVVEDEETLRIGLEENLKAAGYETLSAGDGPTGLKMAIQHKPDLILLDIMLPGLSGYEVCRKLRETGADMYVIMLTARHEEFDKIHGFEMGADDYVTKPFSINELLARIKSKLARGRRPSGRGKIKFADCELDLEKRILIKKGREVTMTRTEFDLLAYLCVNEGKALSRDQVMNDVWGTEYFGTQRSIDSFVASLRSKIEKKPAKPEHILTIHGIGYKFAK